VASLLGRHGKKKRVLPALMFVEPTNTLEAQENARGAIVHRINLWLAPHTGKLPLKVLGCKRKNID
jgi:hypothetical protein